MRVYHIVTHFDLGGAERVVLNIANSKKTNIEYHIFEVVRGKSKFTKLILEEMKCNSINYHRSVITNNKIGIIIFPIYFFLYNLFHKKPSVIHTHTEIPDLAIYIYHKLFRLFLPQPKLVRTIHNTQLWNEWKFIGLTIERFFQEKFINIAISRSVAKSYVDSYGGEDLAVIYNGISISVQKPFPELKLGKINILFAGRFEYQKGISELIQVILNSNNPFLYFHIVGKGSLSDIISKTLKNKSNVSIYESIYNLSQFLSSFDYLFMPSNFEGLGLMAVEASMHKLPSIINNCTGLNEVFPEEWILKVNNNNVDHYVKILDNLDEIDRNTLGEIAYSFVHNQFSIQSMQEKYEEIYLS